MDMIGNAAEWLGDTFVPSYEGAPTDGSAWEVAGIKVRCARGGGPNTVPEATASARAGYPEPSSSPTAPKAGGGMGFRCCASGPAAPSR
jgi:formylglycine-generating enzyme required for sulfatase activity